MNLVATAIRPIITQNSGTKAVIQDIESYQKMQNALALLKLIAQSEADIKNNRFESQESFFEKIEKNLV